MSWAITYSKDSQSQMIYTFGIGPDQHLHAKFWNWVKTIALWADLGAPSGTQAALGVGLTATTYYETGNPGKQRIHVFVIGDDQHLHVDSWNGSNWMWHDQGMPSGTTPWSSSAITFYQARKWRIYVFVATDNGRFHVNYWNGAQWNWADQGRPVATPIMSSPSVVTYVAGKPSKRRIYAFGSGQNGHLYADYWNGSAWTWIDLGTPPGTVVAQHEGAISKAPPTAITFPKGRKQRVYAFVVGDNHHLYVKYWNGAKWAWAAQGTPSGTTVHPSPTPAVITYVQAGEQRIYAFVVGADHHLHVNYWNGKWHWADLGRPSVTTTFWNIAAITFSKARKRLIYVFASCTDGHLRMNRWNGTNWTWSDLGTP
jgi:hypothetical protein